jgi:diguanylate cyclase (GGDEF)-like protein/PAS domain S-box-containing protein
VEQLKILVVEDSPADAELAMRELQRAGLVLDFHRVHSEESLRRALDEYNPQLILSDFSMPGFGGLAALDLARAKLPDVPFVFVSGTIGEDRAVEAMRRGATDYVLKDRMSRLVPVVERALQEAGERSARRRAEQWRDLALEASGVALWDNDVASGRVYLNEHWARLLDHDPRETVTTVEELTALAHPDDRQMLQDLAGDTIRGRRASYDAEHRVMARGGDWKWILSRGKVVERDANGRALRVIGTNVDITERKIQEQRIARLSRIHAVLSGINSAIVRIRDRQELLAEACRIAVEHGRFAMSWIGMVNDSAQEIKPVARAGRHEGYLERLKLTLDPTATRYLALAVEALGRSAPVICNDIANDGRMRAWRQAALEQGFRSNVMLPLLLEQRAVGVFALYSTEVGFFDEDEMKLLVELAGDIGFALQTIEQQEKLEYLSYYDTLTGLPNRALFIDRAGQQMRARGGEPLMVAMILLNIERFRYINESFGHRGGDELLKLVARRLESAFRGKDYLARVGADGFGLVVRGVRDAAAVVHLVENQVLACFQDPYSLSGSEVRVAAKAGIAMFPADGADADTLFKNAEAALKKARDSGERHLFYAADMNARAAHALSMETRLRKAVADQRFVLHYQPKINLGSDSICGLEALLRWDDPEAGLVPPNQFVPLLEETGLILEVGRWAIRHALSQRLAWRIKGLRPPHIAVNVSAIQLRQGDFVRGVRDSLDTAGVGPHGLDLEITESMVMKDVDNNIAKLRAVRDMGVDIAIDDFGTGYSSLSYAARLPINSLKIDRSFINGMAANPHDMAIVTTIIALARSLNLSVVAEGVETADQARLLSLVKCDEAQGYLFSKPLPAHEIEPLLRMLRPEAANGSPDISNGTERSMAPLLAGREPSTRLTD